MFICVSVGKGDGTGAVDCGSMVSVVVLVQVIIRGYKQSYPFLCASVSVCGTGRHRNGTDSGTGNSRSTGGAGSGPSAGNGSKLQRDIVVLH